MMCITVLARSVRNLTIVYMRLKNGSKEAALDKAKLLCINYGCFSIFWHTVKIVSKVPTTVLYDIQYYIEISHFVYRKRR
jgi:hypothetical protein